MGRAGRNRDEWQQFDGGIEQTPERAQPGQVLDARNVWAPYGATERRPGTRFIQRLGSQTSTNYNGSGVVSVDNGDGTWTHTLVVDNTERDPALSPELILYAIGRPRLTPNGGITFDYMPLISGPPLTQLSYDTRTFQLTTNYGPSSGYADFAKEFFLYTGRTNPFVLAEIDWGGKLATLIVLEAFVDPDWVSFFIVSVNGGANAFNTAGAYSFINQGVNAALGAVIPAPTSARIATVAQVPSFDVTYINYNRTMYTLTPTDGFALAHVNQDPNFVGPRQAGGVTPPFSVDVLAQLASPPRAAIVVYGVGHVFALDIIGEQYYVRWTAPVIATGPNLVWPLVNFEPLDEDGGKPRAAKMLHEFLVVYQAQNIYTFVNDGTDPITGLALFDPKRVVSGVGTEAHNAVVEVQGRHLFPARDGFYAFDGSPIPQKLSDKIDPFYQRLGRANIAQSRGVHWLEKHVVLWAVKQGATSDPRGLDQDLHYVIMYDYLKQAWWIWDNVVGGGGLARMFRGDTQAGIYILSSVAFLYRMTGNADDVVEEQLTPDGRFENEGATKVDLPAAWILTHRLGEPMFESGVNREVWVEGTTDADTVEVSVITDDDPDPAPTQISFRSDDHDIRWNAFKWGQAKWMGNKRREQPTGIAAVGRHVQLKIQVTNALNRAWKLVRAAVFNTKLGRP